MKKAVRLLAAILAVCVVVVVLGFVTDGVPLFAAPDAENTVGVIVEHAAYPEAVREYADPESIELAVALLGYLRYSPWKALSDDQPLIQITYLMDDGSQWLVSANKDTVWFDGKPRALREENAFVKLCTAVFFSEINLIYGPASAPNEDNSEAVIQGEGEGFVGNEDYPAAIMVDSVVYYLETEMPAEIDESAIIGYTDSYTEAMPESNGETNFDRELNMPYARVEGGIAILYQNEWWLCTAEPEE